MLRSQVFVAGPLRTVTLALKLPADVYVWLGLRALAEAPSPKAQE
jgi:hypothetical protein